MSDNDQTQHPDDWIREARQRGSAGRRRTG